MFTQSLQRNLLRKKPDQSGAAKQDALKHTKNLKPSFYVNGKAPVIFSPCYDFSLALGPREGAYPFNFKKRGAAFQMCCKALDLSAEHIYSPPPVSEEQLRIVHTAPYLQSLRSPSLVAKVMGIPELASMGAHELDAKLLAPLRVATGGTILGARLALEHGWAFNFSGGFHHAYADRAEGFCFYADTALAVRSLWRECPDLEIIIVDVDAHGMNGLWELLGHDPRVTLFDIYNRSIYPASSLTGRPYPIPAPGLIAKERDSFQRFLFPVDSGISDRDYLGLLWRELPKAFAESPSRPSSGSDCPAPRLVIAHLGQDPFIGDRLGRMKLGESAILERDAFIFEQALQHGVPILSLLAGGYSVQAPTLIAKSLLNIIHRYMDSPLSMDTPLSELPVSTLR